jgi:hypothetical protein
MITCCEIAITLALTNIISLAVFAGYTVKIRQSQVELEKKNGYEQKQIDDLKKEIEKLSKKLSDPN